MRNRKEIVKCVEEDNREREREEIDRRTEMQRYCISRDRRRYLILSL